MRDSDGVHGAKFGLRGIKTTATHAAGGYLVKKVKISIVPHVTEKEERHLFAKRLQSFPIAPAFPIFPVTMDNFLIVGADPLPTLSFGYSRSPYFGLGPFLEFDFEHFSGSTQWEIYSDKKIHREWPGISDLEAFIDIEYWGATLSGVDFIISQDLYIPKKYGIFRPCYVASGKDKLTHSLTVSVKSLSSPDDLKLRVYDEFKVNDQNIVDHIEIVNDSLSTRSQLIPR